MANSTLFKSLKKRVSELKRNLLPHRYSPTGSYSPRTLDKTRGFRLLVHAEIESYLERSIQDLVTLKISQWHNTSKPNNLIIAFLACYHSGWDIYGDLETLEKHVDLAKNRTKIKDSVQEAINIAQLQFRKKITDNHGVREKNLKSLILPTGIELTELIPSLLTELDELGKSRGEIAHNSVSICRAINPQDELRRVDEILLGLEHLDNLFQRVKKS